MAVINPINARRSIDVGGIPSTQIDDGVGRGLQQVGGAVNQYAARLQEMKRQDQAFAAQQAFNRWNDENALEFTKLQQGISVSGEGFADKASSVFTQRSEQFLKDVPPEVLPKMQELVATARSQLVNRGIVTQIDQRNSWFRTGITDRVKGLEGQVFNDPAILASAKSDAIRMVRESGLPITEKDSLERNIDDLLTLAVGKRLVVDVESNPSSARNAAARLGIPSAEASQAKRFLLSKTDKDGSHISGMQDTFAGKLANMFQAAPPEIQQGLGVYSGYRSVERQRQLFEASDKSGRMVARPGRSNHNHGTAADLSFNGRSLKHAPKEVLDWVHSNAGRFGLKFPMSWENWHIEDSSTRGGKHAEGETGKARVPSASEVQADPRFANLSLTQRLTLYDQMMAAAQRGQTAIDAQNQAAYDTEKGVLRRGIELGDITSPQEILNSRMDAGDQATLLSALRTRQGDQALVGEAIRSLADRTWSGDVYNEKDKKILDLAGAEILKNVPVDQQSTLMENIVNQTGYVPEPYFNKIRAGLDSQIPNDFGQAMELAYRLNQANPIAFGRSSGGDAIQKKVNDYDYMINKLAMTPEDAAKRLAEENNPDKIRDRKALEPLEKQFVKDLTDGDLNKQVVKIFDEWWTSDPQVGFDNQTAAAIQSDYLEMARREFVRNGGDADRAKDNAAKQMKDLYGVTQITGSKVIMRNPPDNYWPQLPNTSDPFGYVKTQLIDQIKAAFPDDKTLNPNKPQATKDGKLAPGDNILFPEAPLRPGEFGPADRAALMGRIRLTPLRTTQQEADAKKMPGYMVSYIDDKGFEQVLNNGRPWKPDFSPALKAQEDEQARQKAIAQTVEQHSRAIAEDQKILRQSDDGGRGASLDAVISGPTNTPQTVANPNPGFSAPIPQSANPSVQGNLKQQRTQLFQNAKDSGMLNGDQ